VDVGALLEANEQKDLLRILTAGSVDDGKSTLIGRLLYDSKLVYEDHLKTLAKDSKRVGHAGESIDYSLLTDGLKAEREQGITIDVAYRYFSTPRRKFIIADCPGHEQYTRNMATGASTADLGIILVDAKHGVLDQTRRHSFITSLLGISHLVVAVNKMDLVGYDRAVFDAIQAEYLDFAARLEVKNIHFVPMSALMGDNVVERSSRMPWFRGGPLLDYLESVHVGSTRNLIDLRFPVQYVLRQDGGFRGYSGTVASGLLRAGASITALPSGKTTRVKSIVTYSSVKGEGEITEAFPPMAVTVTLDDEVDISRGDMLVNPKNLPDLASDFEAVLVWMNETPMAPEQPYLIKHACSEARAEIANVEYKFDINNLSRSPCEHLELNEIGRVHLRLSKRLAFDAYARNRATGAFILIDPIHNGTVAAGMILDRKTVDSAVGLDADSPLLRSRKSTVTTEARAARLGHRAMTVWLTGLPCSGKSTLAYRLEARLFELGVNAHVLDGENLRQGISQNLGFAALERSENVRRAAHIARLCNDAGLVTIVALVSPYAADRTEARAIVGADRFTEVHLSAPVEVCEARDTEGLYARARTGEIARFTGVSAPYEAPETPELVLDTATTSERACLDQLVAALGRRLS
jgi:bifunctional enzyme CysN/CysC